MPSLPRNLAAALAIAPERLGEGSPIRVVRVPDREEMARRFADDLHERYLSLRAQGRTPVVFIVPVGPVGQYDLWADRCNAEGVSLRDLVLINMDEYLTPDGRSFISIDDPLSFRRHMRDHFYGRLAPGLAPLEECRLFPDPDDLGAVDRMIERCGGVDVCFGGVGIMGHIAFNDPPEFPDPLDAEGFADLPTRVVRLSRETILINSVAATRGNVDRMPRWASTVGMREILNSRQVRLYLHREWQAAIVRKMLHGPITPAVPASLLQRHPDCVATITEETARLPEPGLR
ncbi:MAG TPA: glucosamine-6-phosphate isomerase [Azospirillaceae bacterium]|nr:glucosamine-6-phosphate isomerase [Azospirillaceae bacterium]